MKKNNNNSNSRKNRKFKRVKVVAPKPSEVMSNQEESKEDAIIGEFSHNELLVEKAL